jgi:Immunity protein 31
MVYQKHAAERSIMVTKFQFFEIVRVIAQSPRIRQSLIHKEGIIVGISDPDVGNSRDYAVHINEYMETFGFSEDQLESCGRIGKRQDVVSKPWRRGGHS